MNEASSCIQAQISVCRFGHQRRDNRFSSLMQQLLKSDIGQSFPSLFGCQYQLKNFYRFVNNASVTHQKIIEGYQQGLINYSLREQASGDQQTWYMIHDSSLASYNGRNKLDLGYLEQVDSNGFVMHNELLLNNCYERMRYLAQHKPTHAAEEVFSQDELKLTRHLAPQYLKSVDLKHAQPTSILWLVLLLARMGGHQGIRQKGLPGWQTLWKGYQLFEKIYTGFKINLAPG